MRIEKYQVKRTEQYEGGRQKITETRYRILEGKVIDDAQGTAYKSAEKARVAHCIRPAVGEKQKTQEHAARERPAKMPGLSGHTLTWWIAI
jgi:hypothetical protein